jgi:hypothetical protein
MAAAAAGVPAGELLSALQLAGTVLEGEVKWKPHLPQAAVAAVCVGRSL